MGDKPTYHLFPAQSREVRSRDVSIGKVSPCDIVHRGISHAPEGRKVFSPLTTVENLTLGAFTRRGDRGALEKARERVFGLLPLLKERR
jgi:branched-chain amino acid transport system ATP-binding protein